MVIDGYTRLAVVVAKPIKHSLSPFIHNTAFETLGLNAVYLAWEIEPEDVEQTIATIRRYDLLGMNISMPYKQAVIPYVDQLSPTAELVGAVNCISRENGQLIGHNTDGQGFFMGLEQETGLTVSGKKVILIGAGGAGMAILAQAALDGAASITVFSRRSSLAKNRDKALLISQKTGMPIQVLALEDEAALATQVQESDLLVNATSVGMDGVSSVLPATVSLPAGLVVADVIYQPFETPFLARARQQGLPAVNGLGMLVYQAAISFKIWTGQDMPIAQVWAGLTERLGKQ